ncbi:uncharacterized protein LOC122060806 [Macadamia integrifolia]|uniref:uncharacterized protein LOC122060806 n=1 Tax=Macadamia integrifolia TaxID=60698 RepID=UPI001C4F1C13|nr:uncharacterized protein LOC122060806 [Macadamia integrifolia]
MGSATEYSAMVDSCFMSQLPSSGRKFTWSNNRKTGNVSVVLDRSFCNEQWLTIFQDSSQVVFPRIASDHGPILMTSIASQHPLNYPFWFHQFWMDHEEFNNVVASSWLDSLPGNEEIRRAVWELDPDSWPGPDGFSGAFFRKCWSLVEVEVCNAHLEPLLPRMILEEQGAFQKGKLIHDNISAASELANLMFSTTRGGGLGLKIDIKKAYDTISWSFVFQGYFGVERGLIQGDPISPMLFIIAEKVLSRGLSSLVQRKELQAIHGPRGATTPRNILFMDDIFIFTNASLRYVRTLKNLLMKYQEFSSQCISLEKSKLFLGKITPDQKQIIVDTLGIQIYNFPTRYLGVEIFKGRVKKEALLPVMDKVKGRLAGWKGNLLSLAGRTELVRSVIAGIPNHSLSIYWWPSSLLATMEQWMKNFIWMGEIESARKITVKWDALCKPKEEGGLGIRRLRDTNRAMLCKLVWRIKHEKTVASSFLKA